MLQVPWAGHVNLLAGLVLLVLLVQQLQALAGLILLVQVQVLAGLMLLAQQVQELAWLMLLMQHLQDLVGLMLLVQHLQDLGKLGLWVLAYLGLEEEWIHLSAGGSSQVILVNTLGCELLWLVHPL